MKKEILRTFYSRPTAKIIKLKSAILLKFIRNSSYDKRKLSESSENA